MGTPLLAGAAQWERFGEWLVRNGLAHLDWPEYSKGKYGADQSKAEKAGRGIWEGTR